MKCDQIKNEIIRSMLGEEFCSDNFNDNLISSTPNKCDRGVTSILHLSHDGLLEQLTFDGDLQLSRVKREDEGISLLRGISC